MKKKHPSHLYERYREKRLSEGYEHIATHIAKNTEDKVAALQGYDPLSVLEKEKEDHQKYLQIKKLEYEESIQKQILEKTEKLKQKEEESIKYYEGGLGRLKL